MTNRKKKIVVIDSGVNIEHPSLKGVRIQGHSMIKGDALDDISDNLGHGTAIIGIIYNYAQDATFYVIKLFDRDNNCSDPCNLISALNFITDNIDCYIVNLS